MDIGQACPRATRRETIALIGAGSVAMLAGPAWAAGLAPTTLALVTPGGRISQVTCWRAAAARRGMPKGTIVFSHGALSSPAKYDPLILSWVAAGYDVFAPLHVDSTDHPDTKAYAGFMSWRARIEDMRALADHLGPAPRIAAGHSYGALVALTLGGAAADVPDGLVGPLNDPHVTAVVAFSPPGPIKGLIPAAGYATLTAPALIETGTLDVPAGVPPGPDAWKVHLAAYDAAAAGGHRYALVLAGVDHYFGGLICRPDLPGPHQDAQMAAAVAVSRLFLDSYGGGSAGARQALDARLGAVGVATLLTK